MTEPADLADFEPIKDEDGHPWRYSAERDRWYAPHTVLDWDDMRGWRPEVIEAWVARADIAGGAV